METENLRQALKSMAPSRWRDAALSIVESERVSFAGNGSLNCVKAIDLLEIYRPRLELTRRRRIHVVGIEDLISVLEKATDNAQFRGTPFLGTASAIYAFWDERGTLIGCVTANSAGIKNDGMNSSAEIVSPK